MGLADLIEKSNSLNLTGEANHAEDLFARLLNVIFNANYENSNLSVSNFSTVDLIDHQNTQCVQVTSIQRFRDKKNETVGRFALRTFKDFDTLIILFITSKKVPADILKKGRFDNKTVECYDINKLLKRIKTLGPYEKQDVLDLLNDELKELSYRPLIDKFELARLKASQPANNTVGISVDRRDTILSLYNRAVSGHCLVVGLPGIGKSYVLNELNAFAWSINTVAVTIRVNELIDGTDEEINKLLKAKNWLTYLKAIKKSKGQLLIFDAYDTAKDQRLKHNALGLIKKAMANLSQRWHIVVSARTYDASKSPQLRQLFSNGQTVQTLSQIAFEMPILTNDQLTGSLRTYQAGYRIFSSGSSGLRKVLSIPYFLKIFEKVVIGGNVERLHHLKAINTEEELLSIYWDEKITGSPEHLELERALTAITGKLFELENLNVAKSDIPNSVGTAAIATLIGEGVLAETGINKNGIAYSHNILFDFALAKLTVKSDPTEFIAQIQGNPKRPFLYRPSYIYLLKQIWKDDRSAYWAMYFEVFNVGTKEFKIVHQIVFNSVLAISYESLDDIQTVFERSGSDKFDLLIRKLLEALRFSIQEFRNIENEVVHSLSKYLRPGLLWHIGYCIDRLFKSNGVDKKLTASSALDYLAFILQERKTNAQQLGIIDGYGRQWGILNISSAFQHYPRESKALIKQVLEILNEPEFPIDYFFHLVNKLPEIASFDTSFAAQIFKTIYSKEENSGKETRLGSSVVMSFRSTRGQDFATCHYSLEEFFPAFIVLAPEKAITLCLDLVNDLKGKGSRYVNIRALPVSYFGLKGQFLRDGYFGDTDYDYEEGVGKLVVSLYRFLDQQVTKGNDIDHYLLLIFKKSRVGFAWRNLIRFLIKYPGKFSKQSLELLQNDIYFVATETTYEAGELLKALVPFVSKARLKVLEKRIVALIDSDLFRSTDTEHREYCVAQTLSCIPETKIISARGRQLMKKHHGVTNRPIVSPASSRGDDNEETDFIKRFHIDLTNQVNQHAYSQFDVLKKFVLKFEKAEVVAKTNVNLIYRRVNALYNHLSRTQVHAALRTECDEIIGESMKLIAKGWKILTPVQAIRCVAICKAYLIDNGSEPQNSAGRDVIHPARPSSLIRSLFSRSLVSFSNRDDVREMPDLIEVLIDDTDLSVRADAARSLLFFYRNDNGLFWTKLASQFAKEPDEFVITSLILNLYHLGIICKYPEQVARFLRLAFNKLVTMKKNSNALKYYVNILILTIRYCDTDEAKRIVTNGHLNHDFIREVTSEFFNLLTPKENYLPKELREGFGSYMQLELQSIIASQVIKVKELDIQSAEIRPYFRTVDYIVQRMFLSIPDRRSKRANAAAIELYHFYKPIIRHLLAKSQQMHGGLMVAHTGYYLVQLLELFIEIEPEDILKMVAEMVALASRTGFSNEKATLDIVIRIANTYLADYKQIVLKPENFHYLIQTLDFFAESGWHESLDVIWGLNEVFS